MFQFQKILVALILLLATLWPARKVEILDNKNGYQLLVDGTPFYIKGAGTESHYEFFAQAGGNSIRTWGIDQWKVAFAMAEKYNFMVCAGIWMEQERQGFDYSDSNAVGKQFRSFQQAILQYKDHPNLLLWGIGNEMDLNYTNPAVWDAVEEVAKFIKATDGNHPTMTATAFIEKEEVQFLKEKCPSIDILAINAYAGLPVLDQFLKDFGWNKPYLLGEWGTFGHWEVPQTNWNEPIEFTSREKAELYQKEYQEHILPHQDCLGGYVFFWGTKQERTPTWYGMFLDNFGRTQAVDVMHKLWTGKCPENRSPVLDSLLLQNQKAQNNITLAPGRRVTATVWARDPEEQLLSISWEILHETTDKRTGGDEENKPPAATCDILDQTDNSITFITPKKEGAYRIFVYVYDNYGNGAHANIPFFIQ
ncbi:MAG: hypothetical protein JXQ65_04595 [Candidatus Marinimicrobia bacterium]|nr:hypothetical protein [Candidatus Neomarinimicrobiota bacterium]